MQTLKTTSLKVKEHADAKEISRNCYGVLFGGKNTHTHTHIHTHTHTHTHTHIHIYKSKCRSIMSDSLRPPGLYSWWNSPGQNTGVRSLFLLQGIFPTERSNPGLPHGRRILYQLSHKGSYKGTVHREWTVDPHSHWEQKGMNCQVLIMLLVLFQERINDC